MTYAIYVAALLLGVMAGLRTFMPLAAVCWVHTLDVLALDGTPLAFLGSSTVRWIVTALVFVELVFDLLPRTPSRTKPVPFTGRIVSGALSGGAIATATGSWALGVVFGMLGAIAGTLVGYNFRMSLAQAFRHDRPAAVVEDLIALAGSVVVVAVGALV